MSTSAGHAVAEELASAERAARQADRERPRQRRAGRVPAAARRPTAEEAARLQPGVRPGWNVLATELVSYPPLAQRLWLEEREGATPRPGTLRPAAPGERSEGRQHPVRPGTSAERTPRPVPATGRRPAAAPLVRPRSQGLRRLLPGAATLAALSGLWFGASALASSAHHLDVHRLPGSVAVAGGYSYVVLPGDTLWSIARRVEPGADPRALVAKLEAQVHGSVLRPGDRLLLPR